MLLSPLSAEHQYFPDSFLLAIKLSVSPVSTASPSLNHVIFGVGLPVAVQWKDAMSPSVTVLSVGLTLILGETVAGVL